MCNLRIAGGACGVASRKVPIDFACEVSASWKKACPSANFLVKFTKKETDDALDGDEGLELATHNYGRDEWWSCVHFDVRLDIIGIPTAVNQARNNLRNVCVT